MKVALLDEANVREGEATEADFFGRSVLLLRVDGQVRAFANVCMHLGGPLEICADGQSLKCQWHQATFDVRTGKPASGPARADTRLMRLPIKVEDGQVFYVYGE